MRLKLKLSKAGETWKVTVALTTDHTITLDLPDETTEETTDRDTTPNTSPARRIYPPTEDAKFDPGAYDPATGIYNAE